MVIAAGASAASVSLPSSQLSESPVIAKKTKWYEFFIRKRSGEAALADIKNAALASTAKIREPASYTANPAAASVDPNTHAAPSRSAQHKAQNKWYEFFVRKRSTELALDAIKAHAKDGPIREEEHHRKTRHPVDKERLFWITLYTTLVIIIIGLLGYILFFKRY